MREPPRGDGDRSSIHRPQRGKPIHCLALPPQRPARRILLSREAKDRQTILDQREANGLLVLQAQKAQDLTEKAERAQALAEAATARLQEIELELRATAQFREQLLGIVGHDLRNPLGAISMSAQFLVSRGNLGEEDRRLIALILKSAQRMDRMIRQLFEFTRARQGAGMPLELSQIDLQKICLQAVDELQLGSTVKISCGFQGELGGSWDGGRLIEALSNLIGNAMEHAASGTEVLIKAWGTDTDVVIAVHNQGEPISDELLPVLFAPFRSGRQGPAAKPGHLGLGLYVAHEIARSHGGTLHAQSAAGTTIFTMRLPRLVAA